MNKDFLEQYNPGFSSKFNLDRSNLRLELDEEGHPKISELIEQLGISTELAYDEEGLAVNFEYVNDKYRNADRPLYTLEEKKATDIIVALLQSSEKKILAEKSDMTKLYQDSYSGIKSQPILSLMMWGPQSRIVETSSLLSRIGFLESTCFGWKNAQLSLFFREALLDVRSQWW